MIGLLEIKIWSKNMLLLAIDAKMPKVAAITKLNSRTLIIWKWKRALNVTEHLEN